jgi:hypothetical protein
MKILTVFFIAILFISSVFAGGISGGGGGTIIPDPAGSEYIKQELSGARISLLMILKNLSYSSTRTILFQGSDNIIEKIKQYSLKIEMDKPCFDFEGHPNDGSINSDPKTICISAKTIGEKVSRITSYPQLLALMAHEYSHLMGYDEKEATAFQIEILSIAKAVSVGDAFTVATNFISNANNAMTWLMGAELSINFNNNFPKTYDLIKRADDSNLFPFQYPVRALDEVEAIKSGEIAIRIKNLRIYACSQFEADANDKEMCEIQYRHIFNGANEILASDFSKAYYGSTSSTPSGVVSNLVKNPSSYIKEIQILQGELQKMSEVVGSQLDLKD